MVKPLGTNPIPNIEVFLGQGVSVVGCLLGKCDGAGSYRALALLLLVIVISKMSSKSKSRLTIGEEKLAPRVTKLCFVNALWNELCFGWRGVSAVQELGWRNNAARTTRRHTVHGERSLFAR